MVRAAGRYAFARLERSRGGSTFIGPFCFRKFDIQLSITRNSACWISRANNWPNIFSGAFERNITREVFRRLSQATFYPANPGCAPFCNGI